jgi:uncharacterized protein (TIGR02145 family)
MKKITLTLVLTMAITLVMSQPTAFKYQTVVRDVSGVILANQAVSFRISILQDSINGMTIYTEDHIATTNEFGLANLDIGNGIPVVGMFGAIDWGSADHFLEISIDIAGGSNFIWIGASQLLSVPYALESLNAQRAKSLSLTDANGYEYDITVDTEGNIIAILNWNCGDQISDKDGNIYNTVLIGEQCWMKENLKTTKYRNGASIENPTGNSDWQNDTAGAYAWYNNDINWKDSYGALYNWYAVNNANGLCPAGWHVSSHPEWTQLVDYVVAQGFPNEFANPNGASNALKSCRQINSPLGGECNTTEHPRWSYHPTHHGFDGFVFSGFPGGGRFYDGAFFNFGYEGYWWSSTEYASNSGWFHFMAFDLGGVDGGDFNKRIGLSVRCIRDN